MKFFTDQTFVTNKAYPATSLVFFLHLELPLKYSELCDALHAVWSIAFSKTMCIEDLLWPPELYCNEYNEKGLMWCMAIEFLTNMLDDYQQAELKLLPKQLDKRRTASSPAEDGTDG
jgi:hypothetical protein